MQNTQNIAFLDIGTSKLAMIVVDMKAPDPHVLSHVVCPCKALKKGNISDFDGLVSSVSQLINDAQLAANVTITHMVIGFSHPDFRGFNTTGVVATDGQIVDQTHIDDLSEVARAVVLNEHELIYHMIPSDTLVDHKVQENPLGMPAIRLEISGHLVIGPKEIINQIQLLCQQLGVELKSVIYTGAAAYWEIRKQNSLSSFVCIDIGSGSTDIVVCRDGVVTSTNVIPIAGDHITNDISISLRIPQASAHQLKQQIDLTASYEADEYLICQLGAIKQRFSKCKIQRIILARVAELVDMVRKAIIAKESGLSKDFPVVLVGGTTYMKGFNDYCRKAFPWQLKDDFQFEVSWGQNEDRQANLTFMVAHGLVESLRQSHSDLPISISEKEISVNWWEKLKQMVEENIV